LLCEEEAMPLFVGVHKWKPEEEIAVVKESVAFFTAAPEGKFPAEGVELCATYHTGALYNVISVWNAPSKAILEKVFGQYAPTVMKGTEFVPAVQGFPPTTEYILSLYQAIIKMVSK